MGQSSEIPEHHKIPVLIKYEGDDFFDRIDGELDLVEVNDDEHYIIYRAEKGWKIEPGEVLSYKDGMYHIRKSAGKAVKK